MIGARISSRCILIASSQTRQRIAFQQIQQTISRYRLSIPGIRQLLPAAQRNINYTSILRTEHSQSVAYPTDGGRHPLLCILSDDCARSAGGGAGGPGGGAGAGGM